MTKTIYPLPQKKKESRVHHNQLALHQNNGCYLQPQRNIDVEFKFCCIFSNEKLKLNGRDRSQKYGILFTNLFALRNDGGEPNLFTSHLCSGKIAITTAFGEPLYFATRIKGEKKRGGILG